MNKYAIMVKLSIDLFILYSEFHTGLFEDKNKGTYQILFIIAFLFSLALPHEQTEQFHLCIVI